MILVGIPNFIDWICHLQNPKIILHTLDDVEQINNIVEQNKIQYIIPMTYNQMKYLSAHKFKCVIIAPKKYELVDNLDNKGKFILLAHKHKFNKYLPKTYIIRDNKTKTFESIKYPCILKKSIAFGGIDSVVLTSSVHRTDILTKCGFDYVIQEYIKHDTEYVGNFVVINGKITYSLIFMQKYNSEYYIKKKKMTNYVIVNIDIQPFIEIFTKLKYTGAACADFKIIRSQIKIFEINPRFGGTFVTNGHFDTFLETLN